VGRHTELTGAAIASQADPSQNHLSTGTLGYQSIGNRAGYESSGYSVGLRYDSAIRGENKINMAGTGLQVPTSGHHNGSTRSSIAKGVLIVRDGDAGHISRSGQPHIGSVTAYNLNKVRENAAFANGLVSLTQEISHDIYAQRDQHYNDQIN